MGKMFLDMFKVVQKAAASWFLLALILLTTSPIAQAQEIIPGFSCTLRTICDTSETCWLTQSQSADAHVSDCATGPYSLKLCCTITASAAFKTSCNSDEKAIISISAATGEAHVANFFDPYVTTLCAKPTDGAFDILYQTVAPPASEEYVCVTSLGQQTDAHVSDCNDPYDLKLYVRARRAIPETHTVNVQLNIKDTDNTVSIHQRADRSLQTLGTTLQDYSGSYLISYGQQKVIAVVAANNKSSNKLETSQISGLQHMLKITETQEGNKFYLVFTKGDATPVKERFVLVQTGELETSANPSFGYALDGTKIIKIGTISSASIDLNGSGVLQPGIYRIEIEKLDKNETTGANIVGVERK